MTDPQPQVRGRRTVCLAAAALVLTGMACIAAASHIDLFFAEPYTGEKVRGYRVTLPVTAGELGTFEIPADCEQAMAAFAGGAMRWGTQIEKRVWGKVSGDCEYYAFMHRYPPAAGNDFVSGYDFKNAALADLITANDCRNPADAGCEAGGDSTPGVLDLLPLENAPADAERFAAADCYIRDGRFRGRMLMAEGQLRCLRDRRSPGFRVIAVDFSDINGDGYLDAVLRLVPLGPGMSRMPMTLAFTRKAAEAPFSIALPGESETADGGQGPAQ